MKQSTFSAVMANSIKNLLQRYTKGIRFTAILTLLFTISVGQMWGATYTLDQNSLTTSKGAYQTTDYTHTASDGSKWVLNGYGIITTAPKHIQLGKASKNYIKTPSCSGKITNVSITFAKNCSYYIAVWDLNGNKVSNTVASKPTANSTINFAITGEHKQLQIISTRTSNGTSITTSNAAAYIASITITYESNKTVYLKPTSAWDNSSAKFAVYYFNNSTNGWSSLMTKVDNKCNNDVYKAEIPSSYTNLIFVRLDNTATAGDWNKKWDQTADLTLSGTNNMYTISAHSSNGVNAPGSWGEYKEEVQVTYDFQKDGISNVTECVVKGQTTSNKSYNLLGWKLDGWYKEAACTNQWNFSTTVSSEMTLYAKWSEPATTTVYLNANSNNVNWTQDNADIWVHAFMSSTGEYKDIQLTPVNTCDVNWLKAEGIPYGVDKLIFLRVADGAGVVWSGTNFWNQAAEIGYSGSTSYYQMDNWSAVKTATAYQPSTYTISYNGGGGTGSMASTTVECDGSITLPANSFTRTGYTFDGWATSANGNKVYNDEATISNINSNITLYARWKANIYTITSNLTNCSSSPAIPASYTYTGSAANLTFTITPNSGYQLPTSVTVSGSAYTWDNATGQLTLTGIIKSDVAITVTAIQFVDILWYVNGKPWNDKGGSSSIEKNETYQDLTLPTAPGDDALDACYPEKVFVGWSTHDLGYEETTEPDDLFTSDNVPDTEITENKTFYAVFATVTESDGGTTTVEASVTIADYADANSWNNSTKYSFVTIDENITATATGTSNTGKYYTSGENWRIYQNESPTLVIAAGDGCEIKTVKVTYSVSNTGVLTYDGSNLPSDEEVEINATSATFGVGNTGSATNGQVRITAIEVTYTKPGGGSTTETTGYVSKCNCVTGIALSMTGEHKNLDVDETNQLLVTYTPANATCDTEIVSWTSSNNNILSVSNTGLVTANMAGEATITATTEGGVTATYTITVNNPDCEAWYIHYWNNSTSGDECFYKVKPDDPNDHEWRTGNFSLPSFSNEDMFIVNNAQAAGGDSQKTDQIFRTGIGFADIQRGGQDCETNPYPGQDAYGQLSIYDDSNSSNRYIAFYPAQYMVTFGKEGSSWEEMPLNNTTGYEYESEPFMVPNGYKTDNTYKYWVGITDKNGNIKYVGYEFDGVEYKKSSVDAMNTVNGLSAEDMAGKWGVWHIWSNSCANNWYAEFIHYYRVDFDLAGGEGANIAPRYGKAAEPYATFSTTDIIAPTRDEHTFLGWKDQKGNSYNPTESTVTINDDLTLTAQWQINQYTVTLNPNYPDEKTGTFTYEEGELVDGNLVLTYDYNTASKEIESLYTSLSLDGYEFGGWYNAKGVNPGEVSGSKCTNTGNITGNKTYFAKWTKLYSITLSENGTTTTPTTQTSTSYTLPTELSVGTCENDEKQLVGWSTVAIPNPGDKPTSNFYELGETVTLTADQTTFYAVFATAEGDGGSAGETTTVAIGDQVVIIQIDDEKTELTGFRPDKLITDNNNYGTYAAYSTTPSATLVWTVEEGASDGTFAFKNGNYYLNLGGNDNYLSCSTTKNTSSSWTVTESSDRAVVTNVMHNSRKIMWNKSSPRFASYAKNHGLNTNQYYYHIKFYKLNGGTSYSDYSTTCVKLPDPVLSFETEPANPIVFTDAVCGGNSSKQSVTVVGENLRDVVNVSVTGPYKIARTASTALKDFTTSLTLDKTAAGAIHSNYQTVYIISTPPAQSTEATTGTLTFTTTKGNTLTVNLSTPTVTCTQYTLTLVDRGVSTEQPTKYYAGETIDDAPADPEGVCTDPIHYVFDGWAEATVAAGATTYTKVTFPYTVEGNTKFYAVYRYVEDGSGDSGDYVKVTENLDDYSGDYLFVYETGSVAFDGGRNNVDDELDATSNTIEVTINGNTIASNATTDAAKFTIAKVDGGYSIQSASGYYIGWGGEKNGLNTNSSYTVNYLNTISNNTICGKTGYLKFNKTSGQERFRYYQSGQETIALYRKAASYLYTTSPVCGPHLVITEGKDIYVTGGNAGGTRDLVIAQQKVSYKATRLQTSNGLDDGTAPDVKVATNGITVGGVVTSDVKVTIDQTKEQQTDGTYTITGTITVQYQPSANNKQEDIQVQLAVDYNTDAKDNFTVHARSLPSEFVIVAKSGDKWYALNGDMNTNAANPANGQVTLDDDANPTKATFAPCNTIYTFDGLPNTGDRTYVRFQGTDDAWLWASSGTNVGIQNNVLKTTPEGNNNAYNWKLYTEDNITYQFGNANSNRQLTLNGEKFGMYASGVQDIRILPYDEKCLYNYAPSNLKVSVLKGTYVTLTWDAVVGATKYQYSTDATSWTDAGTEPTVTITGLTGDKEYIYYIRAYHEDAGVSQECIDYAEITFTTADCDDVPTNITYTADLNSITVSWTAAAPTATIKLFMDAEGTHMAGSYPDATSPYRISGGLDKNTTYYIQILSDGTCASPIIPVKTEDVEVDIVEWKTDSIIVDINTNETVGVTLENEVSYGTGLGTEATELFFSKYYEASYNVKLVAVYNGTKNIIDLTDYTIQYGKTSWESNYITLKDFGATKGQIQPGEEIILYSYTENNADDKKILDCVHNAYPDGNWVRVTSTNNDGNGTLSFGGDKTIILCKTEYDDEAGEYYDNIIDVIGALKNDPNEGILPTNENTEEPSWGDKEGWVCETGLSIADDSQIGISTNRCLLIRNNTVTSGDNAVASNMNDFVTLCTEWKGAHVPDNDIDNGVQASCDNFAYVGTFDYSDYYTKYEEMEGGTSKFDENDRNPDGTVSIYIPDLYKHACSNIRVKLTNEKGEVLTDREYKVPIMITSDQTTAGQAFLELQENLATVEVDGDGNIIATHPLSLDEVREICKTCDVVIRDNATLTKALDDDTNDHPQVNNVMIYEGASLEIPSGANYNYTINSLSLRRKGDIVASAKVEEGGKLHLPASATAPIYLDMRIDANNWHWFTLPYNCNIADVTWVDGTPAQYNKDWFIMYYDGNSRANEQSIYENHWKVYNGTTIEAGKGYIVGIQGDITHPNHTFELRFPMATEVLTNEHTDKTVAVNAWGVKMEITPNKKGWNLVGNPYLDYYKTSENISFKGLSLLKYTGIDPVTGDRLYDDSGNVPFLVTPVDGGWYEYKQDLASEVNMMPFTAYFVQVGDTANASHTDGMELQAEFVSDNRGRMSLIRRTPQEVNGEQEPVIVRVEVANAKGESDKTTLIIDDRFTNEYEMNADFFKWFGDYYRRYTKPVLYSMGADHGKRAFNALSEQLAAQPVALGMFAAQAGDYTFSLTRKRCDLSRVEEVWLYDATTATYTNLMQQDYTFTTAKTEGEGRFYLSVKMRQNAPTDITDIYGGNIVASAKDGQIIVGGLTDNTQLWIYDATGKLLHTEQTTNFQHVYEAPVAGTYFVRTQGAGQAQTIKVLVE